MKTPATLLALLALACPALAVPALINYQGFVTDTNGNPIGETTPVNRKVIFRVYDDANAGNRLWTEEHTVTLVDGRFSVLLGNGIDATGTAAGEGRPEITTIFAGSGDRFIGITVDNGDNTINESDSEITPRQRVTSSAYALRAGSADRIASGSDLSLGVDNGLGYYDGTRQFNGNSINGPVLYGASGGALGASNGGAQTTALRWASSGDVTISRDLATVGLAASGNATVSGTLNVAGNTTLSTLTTSGNVSVTGQLATSGRVRAVGGVSLYGGNDNNHGVAYYNTFDAAAVNGAVVHGYAGGGLGTIQGAESGGTGIEELAFRWDRNNDSFAMRDLSVGRNLSVTGNTTFTGTTSFTGRMDPRGGIYLGGFGPQAQYLGTAGNFIAFAHANHSEDAISFKENTFYFMDSPGGGDEVDPDVVVGGEVRSNKKMVARGKSVTTGEEELRIVRGTASASSGTYSVNHGSGFAVAASIPGNWETYKFTFSTPFTGKPTITANPVAEGSIDGMRLFCSIWNVTNSGFELRVHPDGGGSAQYSSVNFIAVGPR